MLIIIQWYQPLDSKQANNLESLNEVTTWAILYTLMLFTDFMSDLDLRNTVGYAAIGLIVTHSLIHLFFIMRDLAI